MTSIEFQGQRLCVEVKSEMYVHCDGIPCLAVILYWWPWHEGQGWSSVAIDNIKICDNTL